MLVGKGADLRGKQQWQFMQHQVKQVASSSFALAMTTGSVASMWLRHPDSISKM
jgi:hypothetical protein